MILVPLLLAGVPQDTLKPLKLLFALSPLFYVSIVTYAAGGEQRTRSLFAKLFILLAPDEALSLEAGQHAGRIRSVVERGIDQLALGQTVRVRESI